MLCCRLSIKNRPFIAEYASLDKQAAAAAPKGHDEIAQLLQDAVAGAGQ